MAKKVNVSFSEGYRSKSFPGTMIRAHVDVQNWHDGQVQRINVLYRNELPMMICGFYT